MGKMSRARRRMRAAEHIVGRIKRKQLHMTCADCDFTLGIEDEGKLTQTCLEMIAAQVKERRES